MSSDKNRIFIVDDDESVRHSLRIMLITYGFQAKSFSCTEEFFNVVPNHAPGCLILDLHLPGLNGWETKQRLVNSGSKRPVIIISADEDSEMMKRAYQVGAAGYLRKPFKDQELLDLIQRVL